MKLHNVSNAHLASTAAIGSADSLRKLEAQQLPPRVLAEAVNAQLSTLDPRATSAEQIAKLRSDVAASLGVDPNDAEGAVARTMVKYNLGRLESPSDARAISDGLFAKQSVRTELAGYSNPALEKASGYDYTALLEGMASAGKGQQAFISSATCEGIDGKVHEVSQSTGTPELAITAKQYLGYIDPGNLSEGTDRAAFSNMPKFYCDSDHDYHRATAEASNGLMVAGGGDVAGQNFKEQIALGRPVALIDDGQGSKLNHEINRLRSDNASAWLSDKLSRFTEGRPMLEHQGQSYDLADVLARGQPALEAAQKLLTPTGEKADNKAKTAALQAGLATAGIPVEIFTDAKMFEKTGVTPEWMSQNASAFDRVKTFTVSPGSDQRAIGAAVHQHLATTEG